ncbi:MAG TPA: chemotaxis protein CheB [Gammaproteobacteria bacterium]|nr:chemotaxis protein CheB [Gammaproteobacteria bacterium]
MAEQAGKVGLQVLLVAEEGGQRDRLRDLLRRHDMEPVCETCLSDLEKCGLGKREIDVILIDLIEEPDVLNLENLIESAPAPILFSESSMATGRSWGEKLVHKLKTLAGRDLAEESAEPTLATVEPAMSRPALKVVSETSADTHGAASLCVLGASIGGPEAVKKFLAALPAELPMAFLLAQHIGPGFDHRLATQLDRVTGLCVRMAIHGDTPRPGEVLVVPTGGRLGLDEHGRILLTDEPWSGPYNPTINDVMVAVARYYGAYAGAILFSGMGNDGAMGAVAISDAGGYVWAQDEDSCVISSIPDSARRVGVVGFSGPPGELAQRLLDSCVQRVANGA